MKKNPETINEERFLAILRYFELSIDDQKIFYPVLHPSVRFHIKVLLSLENKPPCSWEQIAENTGVSLRAIEKRCRVLANYFNFSFTEKGCQLKDKLTA